jgi:hypothetical protein
MQSPPTKARQIALWVLGIATVVGFAIFGVFDSTMHAAGGPGIARFEIVADRATAARILLAWGDKGQGAAKQSLWFDFAFLVIYGAFLGLAIKTVAAGLLRRGYERLAWLGSWLWTFAIIGALFDVFEDIALLRILHGDTGRVTPWIATYMAVLKFAFLIPAILYLIAAMYVLLRDRFSARESAA